MRTPTLAAVSAALLTGCGDPYASVEKFSDVPMSEDAPARGAVAAPEELDRKGGFLSGLFRAKPAADRGGTPTDISVADAADETVEGSAASDTLGTQDASPRNRRGFLARLFNPDDRAQTTRGVETAALGPDVSAGTDSGPDAGTTQPRSQTGRGGSRTSRVGGADQAQDVPYGAIMPFATVGRVCEARTRDKGKRVARSDAGYDLHDTAPSSVHPRIFYITGFADGCPRQFTAALAMFGAPTMHEQLRYGRPSEEYPYSDTDKASERVKSAICGVGRRKPCGNRIGSLERNTVFISTYERFTDNGRWADILVHDSAVLAASLKDP